MASAGTGSAAVTPNQVPIANDDVVSTTTGVPVTVSVIANDADPDGDPISVVSWTQPAQGAVNCSAAGDCTYSPLSAFTGTDFFTYSISDQRGGTSTATVTVSVTVNQAPTPLDDALITPPGFPASVSVLANDSDPDGQTLTVTSVTQPVHGTASCSPQGLCTYDPVAGFHGRDAFGYAVSDGHGATGSATVTVDVNTAPVAVDDASSTTPGVAMAVGVLANDTDPEGDALTITDNSQARRGTVACEPSGCTYTPQTGYAGPDNFTYTISDGFGGTATASVDVTVVHVDVPFAPGDVFTAVGDGQVAHLSSRGVLLDTLTGDPRSRGSETDGMSFDARGHLFSTAFQSNQISEFSPTGNLLGTLGSGFDLHPESILFDASGNAYVGQADGLRHVLKFDRSGNVLASFPTESANRGSDWIDLAADQCTLYYTSESEVIKRYDVCNNAQLPDFATLPTAPAYALRIRPNGEILVAASSQANRLDAAGNVIQTYKVPDTFQLFALNLDPDGTSFWTADYQRHTVAHIDIASGAILGTFEVQTSGPLGGLAVVGEITVAMNHPPVASGGSVSTVTDNPVSVALAATDADNDSLTYSVVVPPAHGTLSGTGPNLTYAPGAGYSGADSFTFKANDGQVDSVPATVSITVTPGEPGDQTGTGDGDTGTNPNGDSGENTIFLPLVLDRTVTVSPAGQAPAGPSAGPTGPTLPGASPAPLAAPPAIPPAGSSFPSTPGPVQRLVLDRPSALPGGDAVVRGSGCPARSTVSFSLAGNPVGITQADSAGRFEGHLILQPLPIGRYTLDGQCAGVRFQSPIDLVVTSSTSASSQSMSAAAAAALVFFVLLLGLFSQGRGDPPTPATRVVPGQDDELDDGRRTTAG